MLTGKAKKSRFLVNSGAIYNAKSLETNKLQLQ